MSDVPCNNRISGRRMKEGSSIQDEHLYSHPVYLYGAGIHYTLWDLSTADSTGMESADHHSAYLPGNDLRSSELADPYSLRAVYWTGNRTHRHLTPRLWYRCLRRYASVSTCSAPGKRTATALPSFLNVARSHNSSGAVCYFLSRLVRLAGDFDNNRTVFLYQRNQYP